MTAERKIIILDQQLEQYAGHDAWHNIAWAYDDEIAQRERNAPINLAAQRLAAFTDSLPSLYRDCTFDTLREHTGNRAAIRTAHQLKCSTSLYLWGNAGNGKTHLAIALAHERARTQHVTFWSVAMLFATLRQAAIGNGDRPDHLTPDTLILDDIGKIKATEFVFQELYRMLEERWSNQRPTIFTANHRPSEAAARIIDDVPSQQALTSRFAAGQVVEVRGQDERIMGATKPSRLL